MSKAPKYWAKAKKTLSKKDKVMKKLINNYKDGSLVTRNDVFFSLCKSIIGQQISVAAANSVFLKFKKKCKNKINAKTVNKLTFSSLKSCGLSRQKVKGIQDLLIKIKENLDSGKLINLEDFNDEEQKVIKSFQLLSSKPTFYIANISDDSKSEQKLNELLKFAEKSGCIVIPTCIKIEQEIALLEDEERQEYLELMEMDEPVLNKIIFKGYAILGLQTYFTAGPQEIRAWTIKSNSTAPNAAGVIHTDFERGFIKAEVISFADYISCNGESGAKENGKLRLEGKEYIVKDGDVVHFKFNV